MRRVSFLGRLLAVATVAASVTASSAYGFEATKKVNPNASPFALFRLGFFAYKKGDKSEAVEAYKYAAEKGHPGAQWKLAHMYAEGDGVKEDDFHAYQIFEKIVHDGADPGTQDQSYVADALCALAGYVRKGIPNSPVVANPVMARELYLQAAANFGDADAQYELGRMLLKGEGGDANAVQAARWLSLASKKGNANAEALLGNILFQAGKTVRGLAMLTVALQHAGTKDQDWIRDMHEQAFSVAGEADRRTAIALAANMEQTGDY
jgi:uncharacterized protein